MLNVLLQNRAEYFKEEKKGTADLNRQKLVAALVSLATANAQVTYLLSDVQAVLKRRSERAFVHLQRSIMADTAVKTSWQRAFASGEVPCEQLGATHLLLHGIWAFKADAVIGGRTDLVLGEPIKDLLDVERTSDGLVLTEWKKAKDEKSIPHMFKAAKEQASKYSAGTIAGIELLDYRFLVVLSDTGAPARWDDDADNGITYRRIHISVDPRNHQAVESARLLSSGNLEVEIREIRGQSKIYEIRRDSGSE